MAREQHDPVAKPFFEQLEPRMLLSGGELCFDYADVGYMPAEVVDTRLERDPDGPWHSFILMDDGRIRDYYTSDGYIWSLKTTFDVNAVAFDVAAVWGFTPTHDFDIAYISGADRKVRVIEYDSLESGGASYTTDAPLNISANATKVSLDWPWMAVSHYNGSDYDVSMWKADIDDGGNYSWTTTYGAGFLEPELFHGASVTNGWVSMIATTVYGGISSIVAYPYRSGYWQGNNEREFIAGDAGYAASETKIAAYNDSWVAAWQYYDISGGVDLSDGSYRETYSLSMVPGVPHPFAVHANTEFKYLGLPTYPLGAFELYRSAADTRDFEYSPTIDTGWSEVACIDIDSNNINDPKVLVSDGRNVRVYSPLYTPNRPENVWASDGTYTDKVLVMWDNAVDATSYEVWRNTSSDLGSATKIGASQEFQFSDYTAVPGETYNYWVRGTNPLYVGSFSDSDSGYLKESSLTVTSPNGGENWQRGTSHSITWDSSGNPGSSVKIDLYRGSSFNRTISSLTNNDGSYTWSIPSTLSSASDYRIRIASTSNSSYYDYSNGYFSIIQQPVTPSLTVTSPNGGESWERGTSHSITWDSSGSPGSSVKIELYRGSSLDRTISSLTSNDGSYTWSIPSTLSSASDYRIRITSTSNSSYYDYSNGYFSIVGVNHAPRIWSLGLGPPEGDSETCFSWYADYRDEDGDAPTSKYLYIDGVRYEMDLQSGSPSDGRYVFSCSSFPVGIHDFYFYFADGNGGSSRNPTNGTFQGPIVNDHIAAQTIPYTQTYSNGMPYGSQGWEYHSSIWGNIEVVNGQLRMSAGFNDSSFCRNWAILHLDLSGAQNLLLDLDHVSNNDEVHGDGMSEGSAFYRWDQPKADMLAISDDGNEWYVLDILSDSGHLAFDLDAAISSARMRYTSDFQIMFSQYDDKPWSNGDGRAIDNVAVTVSPPTSVFIGNGQAGSVSYTDQDGTKITVSLNGGTAEARFAGQGLQTMGSRGAVTVQGNDLQLLDITASGTDLRSSLVIKTDREGDGQAAVGDILVHGDMKMISAATTSVLGNVIVDGFLKKMLLGNVADGHMIEINTSGRPVSARDKVMMQFGRVADTSINTHGLPIQSLMATEWLDKDALPDEIEAPWVGKLMIKGDRRDPTVAGDFGADVTLSGADPRKGLSLGRLQVAGTVRGSTVRSFGSIGSVMLGAVEGSDFLAGLKASVTRHAAIGADFEDPMASIKSIKIKGLRLPKGTATPRLFCDSNFSAASIGSVSLLNADLDNGREFFGVFASRLAAGIKSVSYRDTLTGERWRWPSEDVFVPPDLTVELV